MRFVTELDDQNGHWLVLDAAKNKKIVGDHVSPTLAALDANKREQDDLMEQTAARLKRRNAA